MREDYNTLIYIINNKIILYRKYINKIPNLRVGENEDRNKHVFQEINKKIRKYNKRSNTTKKYTYLARKLSDLLAGSRIHRQLHMMCMLFAVF